MRMLVSLYRDSPHFEQHQEFTAECLGQFALFSFPTGKEMEHQTLPTPAERLQSFLDL